MASYNCVQLMGNVTRQPETKHLASGTDVCDFGLAVNRRYRTQAGEQKEEVCFIDCVAFGKQAEVLAKYATKGKPLFVVGRLKLDVWDDRKNGGRRSKHSVVIENFQFLGDAKFKDDDAAGDPLGGGEPALLGQAEDDLPF
jgi:single-strand DNA-binding protein